MGARFGVEGHEFGVYGRVQGSGFRVQGLILKVVLGLGCRVEVS